MASGFNVAVSRDSWNLLKILDLCVFYFKVSCYLLLITQEMTNSDVVLIPMGECQDFVHEGGERMSVRNYINGIKVFVTYLHKLRNFVEKNGEEAAEKQALRKRWRQKFW